MDLRGNIRWVSLTFDYTTDLVGEDSWKWTMAGSKKNCIRATKGKCDVKNQLALGSIDFLQHQHPSSIIGSSQLGLVTRDISKPGILSRVSLVLSSSTTELPA